MQHWTKLNAWQYYKREISYFQEFTSIRNVGLKKFLHLFFGVVYVLKCLRQHSRDNNGMLSHVVWKRVHNQLLDWLFKCTHVVRDMDTLRRTLVVLYLPRRSFEYTHGWEFSRRKCRIDIPVFQFHFSSPLKFYLRQIQCISMRDYSIIEMLILFAMLMIRIQDAKTLKNNVKM